LNDVLRSITREPAADTAEQYSHRVYLLGAIYFVMFAAAIVGIVVLLQWAKHFVTLSQRSNVETLALLFFLVFFAYFVFLSWKGALGALRIGGFELLALLAGHERAEAGKVKALGPAGRDHRVVAVNYVLELEGRRGEPFDVVARDDYGTVGTMRVHDADLTFVQEHGHGSTNVFIYFVHQINKILEDAGVEKELNIVEWKTIDDEKLSQYKSLVRFARNLELHFGLNEAWPKIVLSEFQCRDLERRLGQICRALRNEGFLPDWEYSADHKIPLIPEPLGLLSLGRAEKRVDPVSSMGMALGIVLLSVGVFVLFVLSPPWVPGT
jgi:hypothetical protein